MAAKPSEPRNTVIAKTCGGLAGLASDMTVIADKAKESRERIAVLKKSGILTAKELASLNEIDNALLNARIELQDYHAIPKSIEAELTKRERNPAT